ncbi:MAG: DUF5615 family PIN-like protein [Candidatus Aenigmarchaeota archaeon]|nr:DUF5615 family PIN-like protein [Candidatus Aenigmarchaeota archaeon]
MMVNILADENIAPSVVNYLRKKGHNVKDVREEGLQGTADEKLVGIARQESRIVLTHDKNFGDILGKIPIERFGIILIRCADQRPQNVINVLEALFKSEAADKLENNIVVVSEREIVIHKR